MPKGRPLLDLSNGKRCPRCKETKPLAEFYKSKSTVHGFQVYCKLCSSVKHDKYRRANKPKMAQASKKWRTENPIAARDHGLRTRYGLPFGEYDALLQKQNSRCAICGTKKPGGRGAFHVDHCHVSKRVRGLLCHYCNLGIGNLQHSILVLQAAIQYLTKTG